MGIEVRRVWEFRLFAYDRQWILTACPCHGFMVAPDVSTRLRPDGGLDVRLPGRPPVLIFRAGAYVPLDDRCILIISSVLASSRRHHAQD
jgi:hypothetical protein